MNVAQFALAANGDGLMRNTSMIKLRHGRRGAALIYASVALVAFTGFVSLGVDLARAQAVKTQLQAAADAAARNAASYLTNTATQIRDAAYNTALANTADGSPVAINKTNDVSIGVWDSTAKTFTVTAVSPNAVRVITRRTAATGNGVPLLFGGIYGQKFCDVTASSVAVLQTGSAISAIRVEGIMNPYLAGMPNGTYGGADVSGTAPVNSPVQATGFTVTPGAQLTFAATGSAADDPVNINQNWDPDGQPGGLRTNDSGYLNGMSQLTGQQASLTGVFLDNNAPTTGATPAALDFSTQAQRDYTSISPKLKQPFFIGDGKTSGGVQQKVVVPAGATRLYLGMHDNINWTNNSGYYMVTINGSAAKIVTAQ